MQCWGNNHFGQLGNGGTTNSTTPVAVIGISDATALSVGYSHSCAITGEGTVKCWGSNSFGQLGDGGTNSTTPVTVSGINDATALSAGQMHTCAITSQGAVKCWGENRNGKLGNGGGAISTTPVAVSGISNATAVAAGVEHTCAITGEGTVQCWGWNGFGQLGTGSTTSSTTPVTVGGISNATALAAGHAHTCAIINGGMLQCWGNNRYGQLGNGESSFYTTAQDVVGSPFVADNVSLLLRQVANGSLPRHERTAGTGAQLAVFEISILNLGTNAQSGLSAVVSLASGLLDKQWDCGVPVGACTPASGVGNPQTQFDLAVDDHANILLSGSLDPALPFVVIDAHVTLQGGTPYPADDHVRLIVPSSSDGIFLGIFE